MEEVRDQRKPGWFWMHNAILDNYGALLKPIGLAVYVCLARHANAAGQSWPGKRTIAEEVGCSESSVHAAIRLLVELRLITFEHRVSDVGDMTANIYTLREPPCFSEFTVKDVSSLNVGGARGASPLMQEVHHPGVSPAPGGARGTPPPPAGRKRSDLRWGVDVTQMTDEERAAYYVPVQYADLVEH